jgi:hypothetical protein
MNTNLKLARALLVIILGSLVPAYPNFGQSSAATERQVSDAIGINTIVQGSEQFKDPDEMLRAEDDGSGNWGEGLDGLQMSIRTRKTTFEIGEPIIATILLRNSSSKALTLSGSGSWKLLNITIIDDAKSKVPSSLAMAAARGTSGGGIRFVELPARSQFKYQIRLDRNFVLDRPGSYVMYVRRRIALDTLKELGEVSSANCLFTLVAHPERDQARPQTGDSVQIENSLARGDVAGAIAIANKQPGRHDLPFGNRNVIPAKAENLRNVPNLSASGLGIRKTVTSISLVPDLPQHNWPRACVVIAMLATICIYILYRMAQVRRRRNRP